ncbi:hypothetical protein [Brevundimonas lenta]|uniref:TonB C-terminal domain-containing protein n=1 Tax=Brevundimonas lenta TaxID=424796 RepID=A0A7W6JEE0_9CAUL|nr:hypothetical protein [Brevundimonas lenta]MBB4083571.1 hypothetical protein [Brevundimonas lenta]
MFLDAATPEGARSEPLVASPVWIHGPGDIDFALVESHLEVARGARPAGAPASADPRPLSERLENVVLECGITPGNRLERCSPYGALDFRSGSGLASTILAIRLAHWLQLERTDADGEPVAGKRVRFAIEYPEVWPESSGSHITPPSLRNVPSPWQFSDMYPALALDNNIEGDVILLCVVSATNVNEGCEVFLEGVSEVGFGETSQQLYRNLLISAPVVDGQPHRDVVAATVRWRLP